MLSDSIVTYRSSVESQLFLRMDIPNPDHSLQLNSYPYHVSRFSLEYLTSNDVELDRDGAACGNQDIRMFGAFLE